MNKLSTFFMVWCFFFAFYSCKRHGMEDISNGNRDTETQQDSLWVSEVKFMDASTGTYLASPSLLRLSNGDILASFDYNRPTHNTTAIYRSVDNGQSWNHITDITGLFWANLFEHRGNIYLLGTNAGMDVVARTIVIARSIDDGDSWSAPVTLFDEDLPGKPVRYHCAPTPVVVHQGRLFRAFEALDTAYPWARGYRAFVISIDENGDLMNPGEWRMSSKVAYDGGWDPPGSENTTGWIEGNVVIDADGKLVNLIRVHSVPYVDRAAIIRISDDGHTASFSTADFINLPGGMHKFVVRKDEVSGIYLAMVNNNTSPSHPNQRNILSLYGSYDLREWTHLKTLMRDNQGLSFEQSVSQTGFQYPDWHFDGNDIIYLVRTAYGGAISYHDANRITFGRLTDYRSLLSFVADPSYPDPEFPDDNQPVDPDDESVPQAVIGTMGYVRFQYLGEEVEYQTVRAADGEVWLRQNLGSLRVASSSTDEEAYGHYFQWGRHTDGHQLLTPVMYDGIPSPNNPTGVPNGSAPYYYGNSDAWWNDGGATDKWDAATVDDIEADNGCDPCGAINDKWRLPTSAEWQQLASSENISNTASAFASNLRLPRSGYRLGTTGVVYYSFGRSWSSTPHGSTNGAAFAFNFTDTAINPAISLLRSGGLTIRCIRKD